jgi:3',5'-cyclic AMP phosphodiesterase CpdA
MLKIGKSYKYYTMCLALLLVCILPVFSQDNTKQEQIPEGLNIFPYLQNVTQNSIVVMWETTESVVGTVNYGESEKMGQSVTEPSPAKIHEVKITGLEPGKTYYYQASYGNVNLTQSTFKTAPPDGTKDFRLAVYGDSRSNPTIHGKVVDLIFREAPDLVINTGDLVANGTNYELWKPEFFMPLRKLDDHVPFFTCLGNHEGNSPNYFNYLSLPGNESYYSFDYANAHFICLDTNAGSNPYDESSPQYKWLINDLEKNKDGKWLIVFFHAPLFRAHLTRSIESQRYVWQPIFDKYGVDLVLNGHDHYYTRTYPIGYLSNTPKKGVRHIIAGGGGAPLYNVVENRDYMEMIKKSHHAVIIDFKGDKLNAIVRDVDGNTIDSFSIDRTQTTSPKEYVAYEMFEIERDLRSAISKLDPFVIGSSSQKVAINTTLTVKVNSTVDLRGYFMWTVPGKTRQVKVSETNTKWKFTPTSDNFDIKPGGELQIPINATVDYAGIYPIPALMLKFKGPADNNSVGFRNGEMTIYPIKILPNIHVEVLKGTISVDGKIDDPSWAKATQLSDFVTIQGSARPKDGFQVSLTYDEKNLYVAAYIKGNPEKIKQIISATPVERDNNSVANGENLNINLSDGETTYKFAINPQGSQYDAKNGDVSWNAEWAGKTFATDTGWTAEISVPLSVFGDDMQKKQWYIDIGRWDSTENEEVLLAPTFNVTDKENRLPEYSFTIKDPKLLPKLIFKDSQ